MNEVKLNKAVDAYLESVQQPHSDEYWDGVNKKLAEIQDNSRKLNKRFIPTLELMSQRFDI